MKLPVISVFSKGAAQKILTGKESTAYKTVLSLGWSEDDYDTPPEGFDEFRGRKHRVEINDERFDHFRDTIKLPTSEGAPTNEKVKQILDFADSGIQGPILCHCYAGMSRSPAATVIMRALWLGPGEEAKALEVRGSPNITMLLFADVLLERNGDLWSAFLDMRPSMKHDEHLARLRDEAFGRIPE